ncbi:hypothetical protein SH449x_000771 [Pirellulaceae bacterium SH449]
MSKIELEVGKWYRRRDGEIVYCFAKNPVGVTYPFHKILSFSDAGCTVSTCSLHAIKTWEEMLNDWNFAVGTPFGVLDDGT